MPFPNHLYTFILKIVPIVAPRRNICSCFPHFHFKTLAKLLGSTKILCSFPWGHLDDTILSRYLGILIDYWSHDLHNLAERLLTCFYYDFSPRRGILPSELPSISPTVGCLLNIGFRPSAAKMTEMNALPSKLHHKVKLLQFFSSIIIQKFTTILVY